MKKIQILSWRITFPVIALAIILLISCKSAYVVSDFESKTATHKTIAILPFEMIFTGVKPEKLSDDDLIEIGEADGSNTEIVSGVDENTIVLIPRIQMQGKQGTNPFAPSRTGRGQGSGKKSAH